MPVIQGEQPAIRVVKGDPSLARGTGSDGFPYNVEFQRIYFGNDLKFYRLSSLYFYVENLGDTSVYVYINKHGDSWTVNPGFKYVLSTYPNNETVYSLNSGISVPVGGRIYFRNVNSNIFSENTTNYLSFSVSSSGTPNIGVGGNWASLAPALNNGTVPEYCFYSMFLNVSRLRRVDSLPENVNIIEQYGFYRTFYGCSRLTRCVGMHANTINNGAFRETFLNCTSLTDIGDFTADNASTGNTNLEGIFSQTFKGCTSLTEGPRLCTKETKTMFFGSKYAYYLTFDGCTALQSVRTQYFASRQSAGVGRLFFENSTFYGTFRNCSSFTGAGLEFHSSIGDINASNGNPMERTIILIASQNTFRETFKGCTSMAEFPKCRVLSHDLSLYYSVPVLFSAERYSMYEMFSDAGLTGQISNLRLTGAEGVTNSFYKMFYGCSGITSTYKIFDGMNIKQAGESAFASMFEGCTGLVSSSLPGIHRTSTRCMQNMFKGCTSLTSVGSFPNLDPDWTPALSCMESMFEGCTSLIISPYLPLKNVHLGGNTYKKLFYSCTSLSTIITNQVQQNSGCSEWTYGTPATGVFIKVNSDNTDDTKNASGNITNPHYIPYNWTIRKNFLVIRSEKSFRMRVYKAGNPTSGTFTFTYANTGVSHTLTPSTNASWSGGNTYFFNSGSILLFEFTSVGGTFSTSDSDYYTIMLQDTDGAKVYCDGSLSALLKRTGLPSSNKPYLFYRLFKNCDCLVTGPSIPNITKGLTDQSRFRELFYGCTSLTSVGDIQLTTPAPSDFDQAFGYTALYSVPDLSSITSVASYCFDSMFCYCENISSVRLPSVSTLAEGCYYQMYKGCTNLTELESGLLPYTTLAPNCYQGMFSECSNLSNIPTDLLPATTLQSLCYCDMFRECTSLEIAPDLPATSTIGGCYMGMFFGCINLREMNVAFSLWGNAWGSTTQHDTFDWVCGVQVTNGSFKCPSVLPAYYNNSGNITNSVSGSGNTDTSACYIPYNWTRVTDGGTIPTDRFKFEYYSGTVTVSEGTRTGVLQYSTDGYTWYDLGSTGITVSSSQHTLCLRSKTYQSGLSNGETMFTLSGSGKVNVSGNVGYLYSTTGNSIYVNASNLFLNNRRIYDCESLYFRTGITVNAYRMFRNSSVYTVSKTLITNVYIEYAEEMFAVCNWLTQGANLNPLNTALPNGAFRSAYADCQALVSLASWSRDRWLTIGSPNTYNDGDEAFLQCFVFCGGANFQAVRVMSHYIAKKSTSGYSDRTFQECFYGCSNLQKIEGRMCRWPDTSKTKNWVYGVASQGTFYHTSEMTSFPHGVSRIPQNWSTSQVG